MTDPDFDEETDLPHLWKLCRRDNGKHLWSVGPCLWAKAYWVAYRALKDDGFPDAWFMTRR